MSDSNEGQAKANNQTQSEKPKFVKQSLPRSESVLGTSLKAFTQHDTRKRYEKHNVKFQCEAVLGPFGKNRTCWLCGFPIGHLSAYKDPEGKFLFQFDRHRGVENKMLDDGTCEHVLPVKLGHGILELLYLEEDPKSEQLLHAEYEFAHNFCNYVKSDEYFITLPLGSTNFCSLEIKEEIIDGVLERIFHKSLGEKGSMKSSLIWTDYEGKRIYFKNPVQAYCFSMNRKAYLEDPEKVYRETWFPFAKKLITDKMKRLIEYVKIADHCTEGNALMGTHYKGFSERLETGLGNVGRGLKSPQMSKLRDPYKSRVAKLTRSPSLNNILTQYTNSRPLPFRSPSLTGYEVNESYSRPSSRGSRTSKSPSKVSEESNQNESNSSAPAPAPVPSEVLYNLSQLSDEELLALVAQAEGQQNGEQQNEAQVVSALAAELSSDESSRQSSPRTKAKRRTLRKRFGRMLGKPMRRGFFPRTRKQKETNNTNNTNNTRNNNTNTTTGANTNTSSNTEVGVAPVQRPLKNRLVANTKENGIYVSGPTTYKYKNNIKALGAKWNPQLRQWVLPLGTNLSPLM